MRVYKYQIIPVSFLFHKFSKPLLTFPDMVYISSINEVTFLVSEYMHLNKMAYATVRY